MSSFPEPVLLYLSKLRLEQGSWCGLGEVPEGTFECSTDGYFLGAPVCGCGVPESFACPALTVQSHSLVCVSLEASSIGVVWSGLYWSAWLCGVEAGGHCVSVVAQKV